MNKLITASNVAWICGLSMTLAAAGCGSKSDSGNTAKTTAGGSQTSSGSVSATGGGAVTADPASTPAVAANPTDLVSNLKRADAAILAGLPKLSGSAGLALTSTGLADIWTLPNMLPNPMPVGINGGAQITLKDYMGDGMDTTETAGPSVFLNYRSNMFIFCVLTQYMTKVDQTNQPADGVYSLSFDLASPLVQSNCKGGKESSGTGTATVTVTTTTDQTTYDKKYEIDDGDPSDAGYVVFAKTGTDGTFNLATLEPHPSKGFVSRGVLAMDPVAKTIKYERIEHGFSGNGNAITAYNFDRFLIDNANGVAYLLGSNGMDDASNYVNFAVAGDTSATQGLAVSMTFKGQIGPDALDDHDACINATNGDVMTDDVLNCGAVTVPAISTATVIDANRLAHKSVADYTLGETTTLPFASGTAMVTVLPAK